MIKKNLLIWQCQDYQFGAVFIPCELWNHLIFVLQLALFNSCTHSCWGIQLMQMLCSQRLLLHTVWDTLFCLQENALWHIFLQLVHPSSWSLSFHQDKLHLPDTDTVWVLLGQKTAVPKGWNYFQPWCRNQKVFQLKEKTQKTIWKTFQLWSQMFPKSLSSCNRPTESLFVIWTLLIL